MSSHIRARISVLVSSQVGRSRNDANDRIAQSLSRLSRPSRFTPCRMEETGDGKE
jgi:hypothetical protein